MRVGFFSYKVRAMEASLRKQIELLAEENQKLRGQMSVAAGLVGILRDRGNEAIREMCDEWLLANHPAHQSFVT